MTLDELKVPYKVWRHNNKKLKAIQEYSWVDRIIVLNDENVVQDIHNTNSFKPIIKEFTLLEE